MKSDVIIEVEVGFFLLCSLTQMAKIVEYTKCKLNWNLKLFLEIVKFIILF